MSGRAYFDWNASAMLRPAARTAMVEALAQGAVRASLGWSTTEGDVDGFLRGWNMLAGSLLKEGRSIAA